MNIVDIVDSIRQQFVSNPNISPSRSITYTRKSDLVATVLNCFVGGGDFRKEDKEYLSDKEYFSAVFLTQIPKQGDTITYGDEVWKVIEYKGHNPYNIICEKNKRNTSHNPSKGR